MDATHFNEALGDVKPAIGNQRPYVLLEVGDELAIPTAVLHIVQRGAAGQGWVGGRQSADQCGDEGIWDQAGPGVRR